MGKLTSLNVGGNSIGDAGALAVSKALESGNCKLTSLNVGWNRIGDAGALAVSKALESDNCKLTSLNVGCSNLIYADLQARLKNLCESMVARQLLAFGQGFSARLGADSAIGGCPLDCMQSISHYVYRV